METVSEGGIANLKIGGGGIASDTKYRVMTCLLLVCIVFPLNFVGQADGLLAQ